MTPTPPMGGGTQLFEGAHLTGAIRAFVANQANVAITGFCKEPITGRPTALETFLGLS